MAANTIPQHTTQSQVTLKSGKTLPVPEGADPEAFRKFAQAREDRRNRPTKKTKSPRRTYQSRRRWTASKVLSTLALRQRDNRTQATAKLVSRVNDEDDETESIFITAGEDFQVLEVAR
jgi:hypothetical protein